jgi:hypothetical protein
MVESVPRSAAVVAFASSRHPTENARIHRLAWDGTICLILQLNPLDAGKSANELPKAPSSFKTPAHRSGFNSSVLFPNFMVPCLIVRFLIKPPHVAKDHVLSSDLA